MKEWIKLIGALLLALLPMALMVAIPLCWCVNLYKFCTSDFEPSWKREAIHGVAIVVPPACLVTAWLNLENSDA